MRKREIHSVAHWAMMFILLMFPLLMVVVGAFQNADYEPEIKYEQNALVYENQKYTFINSNTSFSYDSFITYQVNVSNVDLNYGGIDFSSANNLYFIGSSTTTLLQVRNGTTRLGEINLNVYTIQLSFTYLNKNQVNSLFDNIDDYFYQVEIIDNYHYKNDVNLWTKQFLDLPINSWYKSLMNVIGVGFTNSSVMNVIYVMPVYILWVFIFDVIVDCFLVIIKLPHKLLNRLSGGENE